MPETMAGTSGAERSRRGVARVVNDAEARHALVRILGAGCCRAEAGLAGNLDRRSGMGR